MRRFRKIVSGLYLKSCYVQILMKPDSAESVHEIPVSLQLVGRRLDEENLLDMTDVILKATA